MPLHRAQKWRTNGAWQDELSDPSNSKEPSNQDTVIQPAIRYEQTILKKVVNFDRTSTHAARTRKTPTGKAPKKTVFPSIFDFGVYGCSLAGINHFLTEEVGGAGEITSSDNILSFKTETSLPPTRGKNF